MAKKVSDTHRSCKGWPHLLWGYSVLQLPQLQPTGSEKLLTEYLNLGPVSLPPRLRPAHPHRLTQLNVPSYKLWGSGGWNLPTPSALPLCQPLAQEWLEAARQWGRSRDSVSWGGCWPYNRRNLDRSQEELPPVWTALLGKGSGPLDSPFTAGEKIGVPLAWLGEKPSPDEQEYLR